MLQVHPWVRGFATAAVVVAVFLTRALQDVLGIYVVTLLGAAVAGVLTHHLQLVLKLSLPLLAALLLVWGVVLPATQVPVQGMGGFEYAFFIWARFLCCGAALQVAMLPLFMNPLHLRVFLAACRIPHWLAVTMIGAIVFMPEIGRRFRQLVDARRAQGLSLRGFRGVREIPWLVMPLVSSLLEAALARAEFWSHRGVLEANLRGSDDQAVSLAQSLVCALVAATCLMAAAAGRWGVSWT